MSARPAQLDQRELGTSSRRAQVVVAPAEHPELSVVVVTYGTGAIVLDCLSALVATLPAGSFEVIVVVNPCEGGMPTDLRLRATTSGVRLLVAAANLGFAGGNEAGIAIARGRVLCLLNPDAVVASGWAPPLLAACADPAIGIAAPLLRNPDGSLQECGHTLDHRGDTLPIRQLPPIVSERVDVTYSSAACWMLTADVHRRVGGFDVGYHPAYFEDVDFALRVHQLGLRTVVCPASEVVHHSGRSTRARPAPAIAQQRRFRRRWANHLALLAPQ